MNNLHLISTELGERNFIYNNGHLSFDNILHIIRVILKGKFSLPTLIIYQKFLKDGVCITGQNPYNFKHQMSNNLQLDSDSK